MIYTVRCARLSLNCPFWTVTMCDWPKVVLGSGILGSGIHVVCLDLGCYSSLDSSSATILSRLFFTAGLVFFVYIEFQSKYFCHLTLGQPSFWPVLEEYIFEWPWGGEVEVPYNIQYKKWFSKDMPTKCCISHQSHPDLTKRKFHQACYRHRVTN